MSGIVCAIRGGPASEPTIQQAIATAKEKNLPIYFLYVVDMNFLLRTRNVSLASVSREMYNMGEFILLTVQTRAEGQGVVAHSVVRDGQVGEQIIKLCREVEAQYVVLGRPRGKKDEDAFTDPKLRDFAAHIESETVAQVIFADGV
jgi:nucleotide-binding universal stress UspA family protein